jgi:hypothetical protein
MKGYWWGGAALAACGLVAWGTHGNSRPPDAVSGSAAQSDNVLAVEEGAPFPGTRAVAARLAGKDRAVRALLAGDCTLLEAAARFRQLDSWEPRVRWEAHPEVYAGGTDAERYCRAVLYWVDGVMSKGPPPGDPAAAAAAVRRLGEELEGRRAGGTLALPPAAPGGGDTPCHPCS